MIRPVNPQAEINIGRTNPMRIFLAVFSAVSIAMTSLFPITAPANPPRNFRIVPEAFFALKVAWPQVQALADIHRLSEYEAVVIYQMRRSAQPHITAEKRTAAQALIDGFLAWHSGIIAAAAAPKMRTESLEEIMTDHDLALDEAKVVATIRLFASAQFPAETDARIQELAAGLDELAKDSSQALP
jgi:hypothetical protein